MKEIKILDTAFAHGTSLGTGDLKINPKYVKFDRNVDKNYNGWIIFTENNIMKFSLYPNAKKIAWLLEPKVINQQSYNNIRSIAHNFEKIFTHDTDLIDNDKFLFYPFGGCWIYPHDRKIYDKTKNVSIIASTKRMTDGHQMRHEIIEKFGNQIELFGRGYKTIENKLEGLKDFRYQIVVENTKKGLLVY